MAPAPGYRLSEQPRKVYDKNMDPTQVHPSHLLPLFQATGEAVLLIDRKGQIRMGNPAAARLFGTTPEGFDGRAVSEFIPGGIPGEKLEGDQPFTLPYPGQPPGSALMQLQVEAHATGTRGLWLLLLKAIGAVPGQGQKALLKEERIKTDALLEAIPDTILMMDFHGNLLDFYPPLGSGFLSGETLVKGRTLAQFLPSRVMDRFYAAMEQVMQIKQPQQLDFSLTAGATRFYEARLVPMNDLRVLAIVRDVSLQVRSQKALLREKRRLQSYLDSAASMFAVIRPNFEIVLVNQKVCEVLGYSRDALLGKNWLSFLGSPSEGKRLRILFRSTMEGRSELTEYFESHMGTGKGKKRLIRWRNALLKDPDGTITGLICSGADITEQRIMERELLDSEARNRAILKAIPDVILIHGPRGKILDVKALETEDPFWSPETLEGKLVSECFPETIAKPMQTCIRQCMEEGKTTNLEFSLDSELGRRCFEIRYAPAGTGQVLGVARDITRARSTQRVLDLRNRALEAAGNGILISDGSQPDNPVIYCNEAFTKITGYPREEVIGKNCRFLQGDDTEQAAIETIRKALKEGGPSRVVLRNYRKDGSLFWNELTITPILDETGKATHFIGVQNDVSELIFEGERKDLVRNILESITQDLPLEQCANAILKLLGSRLPRLGVQLCLTVPETDMLQPIGSQGLAHSLERHLQQVSLREDSGRPCREATLTKKAVWLSDLRDIPKPGPFLIALEEAGYRSSWSYPVLSSEKMVLGTCTFFSKTPGKPGKEHEELILDALQLAGLAIERHLTRQRLEASQQKLEKYAKNLERDVAERTREVESTVQQLLKTNLSLEQQIRTTQEAEDRALASESLFAAIARNFPKGVIMVFDQALRYLHLQGEELDRLALDRWDFEGMSLSDTPGLSPAQVSDLASKIGNTLEGRHHSFEFQVGENIYDVNSSPLPMREGKGSALLVFSNITEHKKAEKELLRALQIEQELNELKSRFISMASHEFRTPLSAIHSSAILIGKQNEPGKEEKRLRYLNQIKNNVRNLVVILNDFLSLSKLEEGKMSCDPVRFDLLELIRSVLEELESSLKVGQHFVEEVAVGSLMVTLDPKLMRHILLNLLSNAIKYSREDKVIFIHIHCEGDSLTISVKDEGMGIPEAEQDQLFQRFFRAGNAINIPGTGLGLHIVKQYTELMGGTISFQSRLHEGSTFHLHLPVHLNQKADEENSDH
ncbi:PAS domain S-box protein [Robiginitalea marina]|uniref:histidine kinase n=1 Tax=Robiginitalea marina TaxID=2954105 RepID=A0ABT1AZP9_9FLAO|nr:PAS domain S-box protein [Robiginitalea marina]MCO5725174.1 PAS domain S-box protein [Robiginitalea marina]